DKQRTHFVRTIHQAIVRLTRLLDEILDLPALERGERSWENAPVDAEAALDRALAVCEALLRQRGMRVEFGGRAGTTIIEGDADRLCQVFINVISRSEEHTSELQSREHLV